MSFLERLERKLGRFAIPNITVLLVAGQGLFFVLLLSNPARVINMALIPERVLAGEWWRLFTFLFMPPSKSLVFIFFALYLFFLMGTALENRWGTFRYNIYLLVAWLATVAVSFLTPSLPSSNVFIGGSVFLAFAYLYPEFELYIFFILPVKIKWLALITWIVYVYEIVFGGWSARLLVLASISNFLLFFGKDVWLRLKYGRRRMVVQAERLVDEAKPFHKCAVCGRTDKSDPGLEFRYCTQCTPATCYCGEHIKSHEHVGGDES